MEIRANKDRTLSSRLDMIIGIWLGKNAVLLPVHNDFFYVKAALGVVNGEDFELMKSSTTEFSFTSMI